MLDNPEGDEFDLVEGVHPKHCKKNSTVLSCIGKRTEQNIYFVAWKTSNSIQQ